MGDRYGLPYKGSKNQIAKWIVNQLPSSDVFVDLMCGGMAVTHVGLLSGKYKQFVANDIDGRLPQLFLDCCHGKYTVENHSEWVTREEFNKKKEIDAYIALVWSFGNNGKDYLYGKDIEDMKHAYHKVVYNDDIDALLPFGYKLSRSNKQSIYERYLDYQRQIKKQTTQVQLEHLSRQTEIERLQSLQSDYIDAMEKVNRQYAEKDILIYCDPPYADTNCGKYQGFDSKRFYEWAEQQENIFISEYQMPDIFIPYAWKEKTVLSSATGNGIKSKEMIYTNKRTFEKLNDEQKQLSQLNFAEQQSIFDFIN